MERKNIPFSYGIRRSPSIGNEGELSECVNLIPVNGELMNIQPPVDTGLSFEDGDTLIAVHQTSKFKNYIAVTSSGTLSWYDMEGNRTDIPGFILEGTFIKINTIGNTMAVLTDKGIEYFVFKEDGYKYIGNKVPDLQLAFTLDKYADSYATGEDIPLNDEIMKTDKIVVGSYVLEAILSLLNPALANQRAGGRFYAPFFVRYAYKTTDGSYFYVSPPVLMVPNSGYFPFAEAIGGIEFIGQLLGVDGTVTTKDEQWRSYVTENSRAKKLLDIGFKFNSCYLMYKMFASETLQSLSEDWADIISSVDIFITHPQSRLDIGKSTSLNVFLRGSMMIRPIYTGGYMRLEDGIFGYTGDFDPVNNDRIELPQYSSEEYREIMEGQSVFRLVKSFKIDELKKKQEEINNEHGFIRLELESLENMDTFPALDTSYDYNSRDTLVPKYAFTYNGRMNITNIERYPYCPPANMMFQYTNGKLGEDGNAVRDEYEYSVFAFLSDTGKLVRAESVPSSIFNTPSWAFYPGNANRLIIQRTKGDITEYAELPLKNHPFLNGSYYMGTKEPFEKMEIEYTTDRPSMLDKAFQPYIYEPNKIYTSEVGNPFVFPLGGINTVGTGEIMSISSATKAISQGQFGQFPLYAFCTDGIWALTVSDTGRYSSIQPVSRDVCNNIDSIVQIDSAVVFSTAQGLKMLNGGEVSMMSAQMQGMNMNEGIIEVPEEYKGLIIADTDSFIKYLSTCRIMYDYAHMLLHIFPGSNTEGNLSMKHYVYSLDTNEFSTYIGYAAKAFVPGYPNPSIQIGNNIHEYRNFEDGTMREGMFITRPLAFNDPLAMKMLCDLRMVYLRNSVDTKARIAIYAGNDRIHWFRLTSLRKRSFKWYRFAVFTRFSDIDSISGVSVDFNYTRTNKMR